MKQSNGLKEAVYITLLIAVCLIIPACLTGCVEITSTDERKNFTEVELQELFERKYQSAIDKVEADIKRRYLEVLHTQELRLNANHQAKVQAILETILRDCTSKNGGTLKIVAPDGSEFLIACAPARRS